MTLVIDASVWVAAADATDPLARPSRAFLAAVVGQRLAVILPAIAPLEVACALARRLRHAERGRALANELMKGPLVRERPLDWALLARAIKEGTESFLRGADALYAALARLEGAELISWDAELVQRAGARTPVAWMSAFP